MFDIHLNGIVWIFRINWLLTLKYNKQWWQSDNTEYQSYWANIETNLFSFSLCVYRVLRIQFSISKSIVFKTRNENKYLGYCQQRVTFPLKSILNHRILILIRAQISNLTKIKSKDPMKSDMFTQNMTLTLIGINNLKEWWINFYFRKNSKFINTKFAIIKFFLYFTNASNISIKFSEF